MKTILAWCYGIFAYLTGFSSLVLFILFTVHPDFLSTVSEGGILLNMNPWVVNFFLIALFGIQHSVMARPAFKHWLHQFIKEPFERSTYLISSSIPLLLLVIFWQPINGIFWTFDSHTATVLGYGFAILGWSLVLATTFLINHFDLFGLRQIYYYVKNKPYSAIEFKTPFLYRVVRHPMQLGVVIGVFSTATMTTGHALLAFGMTLYILIGLYFEERDLIKLFGERYREYQRNVHKLIPLPKLKLTIKSNASENQFNP